jgi:hypothetical protein
MTFELLVVAAVVAFLAFLTVFAFSDPRGNSK